MLRIFKIGSCDWCNRHHQKVFLTSFESDYNKFMCLRCKEMITHQRELRDGIPNCIDLWDKMKSLSVRKPEEQEEVYSLYKRPQKYVIAQSDNKNVTLYGFKEEHRWVVEFYNKRSLQVNKVQVWEYNNLAPAKRRYNLCVEVYNG